MNAIPATKAARQQLIVEVLGRNAIKSQTELAEHLAERGVTATISTLSRDLLELGALRVRHGDGTLVYAVPSEGGDRTPRPAENSATAGQRLGKLARELLTSAEGSANLVVLRTPPGAAQYLASAIDHADFREILGTIAGDDTVMVITRDATGGPSLAARFTDLAALTTTAARGEDIHDE